MHDGYYVHNRYTDEQLDLMESKNINSGELVNFINQDELAFCRKMIDTISWPEVGGTSKYHGASWVDPIGQPLKEIFYDKLGDHLGDYELDFFAFQEGIKPWKIHSDMRWYPDRLPYHVTLVPLDVISNDSSIEGWAETYSLTFKQRDFKRYAPNDDSKKATNTDQSHWLRPIEKENTEGCIKGYSITPEIHSQYMSHMPYDWMEGLELETIFRWEPGNAGHWDQNQLHCADNFLARNIKTKLSLIFFTNHPGRY